MISLAMLGCSVPAEVFLILGLPRDDHADAQPPTVTGKDTVIEQPWGQFLPSQMSLWASYTWHGEDILMVASNPDKSPGHAQMYSLPASHRPSASHPGGAKQGTRLNVPSRHIQSITAFSRKMCYLATSVSPLRP